MESEYSAEHQAGGLRDSLGGLDWVDCPECGLPAYVLERFVRPSTDGPLRHAVTVCARLHHLCTTEESDGDPTQASAQDSVQASTEDSTQASTEDSARQIEGGPQ